ncbi:hypothetical protein BBO01nite_07320 [Brevibacillus borstelensis]|nr:hypothetical protein BBO01nite_07320 [Brevibacillus borstelensis]
MPMTCKCFFMRILPFLEEYEAVKALCLAAAKPVGSKAGRSNANCQSPRQSQFREGKAYDRQSATDRQTATDWLGAAPLLALRFPRMITK